MSTLRNDERMQACLMPSHATIRRQKYYIVRSYYNDLENIFCQGCLQSMAYSHNGNYTVKDGWLFENPQNIFDIADAKKVMKALAKSHELKGLCRTRTILYNVVRGKQ